MSCLGTFEDDLKNHDFGLILQLNYAHGMELSCYEKVTIAIGDGVGGEFTGVYLCGAWSGRAGTLRGFFRA